MATIEVKEVDHEEIASRNQLIEPYWLSLGRFMDRYATLENIVNGLLYDISGVDPRIGKAIFSGARLREAMSFINRILDATEQHDLKERLKYYFDQAGLITAMRDNLLHHGVEYQKGVDSLVWNNKKAAHVPERLTELSITLTLVDNLALDTGQIGLGLTYETVKENISKEALEWFHANMVRTWRYKPPPRVALSKTSADTPRSQKRLRGVGRLKQSSNPHSTDQP